MVLWAFKDLVVGFTQLLLKHTLIDPDGDGLPGAMADHNWNSYSSDNTEDAFRYLGVLIAVLAICVVFAVLVGSALQRWLESCAHPQQYAFAKEWTQSPPYLLGIGVTWARIFESLWY